MPLSNGMAKKGSGQFNFSREIGGPVNGNDETKPGPGGSGGGEGGKMTRKGSGQFAVDRSVVKPPTRGPAK